MTAHFPRLRRFALFSLVLSFCAIPLAHAEPSCPGDLNGDNMVTVDELVTAVDAALNGCPEPGAVQSTLPATGQTQCDQGNGTLGPCPGSPAGQDGAIQAGVPHSYTDNEDGTIQDNATGLTWEKLSNDGSIHDLDNLYSWYQAFNVKIVALNTPPCFADHCDWRLPNRHELESLLDSGVIAPAVDPAFNTNCKAGCTVTTCSCTQLDYYLSSTSDPTFQGFAFDVDFNAGYVKSFDKSLVPLCVRAVRGGL